MTLFFSACSCENIYQALPAFPYCRCLTYCVAVATIVWVTLVIPPVCCIDVVWKAFAAFPVITQLSSLLCLNFLMAHVLTSPQLTSRVSIPQVPLLSV